MRVLITGSSGQIGTNLALRLLKDGHFVFGLDKRPNSWTDAFETLLQDISTPFHDYAGGIGDTLYPPDLDIVVHFAAHAKVHELVEQPHRAMQNMSMTFNVLEFCRHNHLPLVFSSSREVYGDIHRYLTEETQADFAYTESPYSASKIAGEALIYAYAQCYGLRYLVFRFSNVYGRYDNDIERMERVVPLFIGKISRGEPITIYGQDKVLDFTYIDDCIAGVVSGLEKLHRGQIKGETVNLAFGEGNSLVDMAGFTAAALGKEALISIASSRVGEVRHYVADIAKAQTLLGYAPQTSLEEGIKKSVAWSSAWQEKKKGKT